MRFSVAHPLILILALGAGASAAGQGAAAKCVPPLGETFRSISAAETQSLIANVAKSNPTVLDKFRNDPEMRREQVNSLRELLAFASQAVKDGLAARPAECIELRSIAAEVTAVNFDGEKNKGRGPIPPFGYITEARVAAFWGKGPANRTPAADVEAREVRFQEFLDSKVAILNADNPQMKDREITEEEREQARDFFAKIEISVDEYRKSPVLTKAFRDKVALQVKLQQAQFLSRLYSDEIATKVRASDAEIEAFLKANPELDPAAKLPKAEEILKRVKSGEDFAKLANEFSDDPGNNGENGEKHGGLYAGVKPGQMIEAFEKAALSLEPGNVHPEVTKTDFGYHVIKLEKKGFGGLSYDVRHILVSTQYKDPDNPDARDVPVVQYVQSRIEERKNRELIAKVVAENAISVPDDFQVPTPTAKAPAKKPAASRQAKRPVRKRN